MQMVKTGTENIKNKSEKQNAKISIQPISKKSEKNIQKLAHILEAEIGKILKSSLKTEHKAEAFREHLTSFLKKLSYNRAILTQIKQDPCDVAAGELQMYVTVLEMLEKAEQFLRTTLISQIEKDESLAYFPTIHAENTQIEKTQVIIQKALFDIEFFIGQTNTAIDHIRHHFIGTAEMPFVEKLQSKNRGVA